MGLNLSTIYNEEDRYLIETEIMTSIVESEPIVEGESIVESEPIVEGESIVESEPIIQSHNYDIQTIKTNFIDKLPEDIVIKIYKEYLEPELYYLQYKNIIESHESQLLNGFLLLPFIPIILAKPISCKYISTKCSAFNYSFNKHKIKKEKLFRLMSNGKSFVATILFKIYH